ncbi:gliding motility lipoprotein GldB [Flaviaesturariibacter terrae]
MLLAACGHDSRHPNISKIKVHLETERFERDFFRIDSNNIPSGLAALRNAHPAFYGDFLGRIVGINPADSAGQKVVRLMLHDYKPIYDSIERKYPSLDDVREDLEKGYRYVKYYYPDYAVPGRMITYIGPLDAEWTAISTDYVAIGLHAFAGKNFSVYAAPDVQQMYPLYVSRRFDREYIVPVAMKNVVNELYPDMSTGRPLLEQLVEKGKQLFLLDHLLPDAPDSVKTGYTAAQLKFIASNEGNIWGELLKNENLYSIDPSTIQTYIGEAPFTQGLPEEVPGNIGPWIGWRMLRAYADRNSKKTLQEILATPARTIYEESRYKPK